MQEQEKIHQTIISAKSSYFNINIKELWKYKDLLKMLVKRDVIIVYKQTILGPLWFVLQPILTSIVFTIVFGNIANLPPKGLPAFAFYLSGLVLWNFFADTFIKNSDALFNNQNLFGKVYFPRLIVPLGIVCSAFVKFLVQFVVFILVCSFHYFFTQKITPTVYLFLFPALLLMMGLLGSGLGLIFTSLTTKYRDLKFFLQFGVQLLMWLAPIAYPLERVSGWHLWLMKINPITHIVEAFKLGWLGMGYFNWAWFSYSFILCCFMFVLGILAFNKTEKDFIDRI